MQQNTNVTKTNETNYKSKQTQVQQNTSITKQDPETNICW